MKTLNTSNESSLGRWKIKPGRLSLILTASLAVAALIGSPSSQADGDNGKHGGVGRQHIEGSWLVTVTVTGGPPPFRAIETYSAGGGLVSTDGATSPSAGHVYQGTWTRTGGREFAFTFLGLQYDAAGVHMGFIRVRETLKLDKSGNAYNATGTVEFLDLDQNVTFSADATAHGTRINAQ